jgi:ankyrin repeat protein
VDGIKALKEEEAYVSVQDNVGRTPIHYAASNGQMDAINALKGANAGQCWSDTNASGSEIWASGCYQRIEGSRSESLEEEIRVVKDLYLTGALRDDSPSAGSGGSDSQLP